MFLTTEKKQAVFLRLSENAENKFAVLYVKDWGTVQVFLHNGNEVNGDIAHSIIRKQEEPVSKDIEYESEKYSCRFSSSKYGHDKIKSAFKAGAKRQKEQMMKSAIDAHCFGFQGGAALFSFELPAGNYLVGSEVKATLIKEE